MKAMRRDVSSSKPPAAKPLAAKSFAEEPTGAAGSFHPGRYHSDKRVRHLNERERQTVTEFHKLVYALWQDGAPTLEANWLGYPAVKCPLDLWIYQEIGGETRPDVVIKTGTKLGATSIFLATVLQMIGHGRVISVDNDLRPGRPTHPAIDYLHGPTTEPGFVERVRKLIPKGARVMAVLDADHAAPRVLREMEAYGRLVTPGCYLIVEDTNINGHPAFPEHGPGPMEAVASYLVQHREFRVDHERERFLMTLNPGGYLRRAE